MIKIRRAVRDDAEKIVDISHRSWKLNILNQSIGLTSETIDVHFEDPAFGIQDWQNSIFSQDENNLILIAVVDSAVVGFCRFGKLSGIGEIKTMYVDPNFVRQGLGKLLMTDPLKQLSCCNKVIVHVANNNKGAISFYKSYGFNPNVVSVDPLKISDSVEIPLIEMEKLIIK